jgi:hypothetical protein
MISSELASDPEKKKKNSLPPLAVPQHQQIWLIIYDLIKQQYKKQKTLDVVSFLSQQQLCMLKMAAKIISPPS